MIREFRGKVEFDGNLSNYNKWVAGSFAQVKRHSYIFNEVGRRFRVNRDTVGQFTGINDANGEKIFEGDVLEWRNPFRLSPEKYFMRWDKANAQFVAWLNDGRRVSISGKRLTESRVIGNIHDNPELLKT